MARLFGLLHSRGHVPGPIDTWHKARHDGRPPGRLGLDISGEWREALEASKDIYIYIYI